MENLVKAIQIAEIEMGYRYNISPSLLPKILQESDAYQQFLIHWNSHKLEFVEQFKIMLLNQNGRLLGVVDISTGGICGTMVDIRLIFAAALKCNAPRIILCHNHPSGNLNPSQEDLSITAKIKAAGELLNIHIDDHLIITSEGYFSFNKEGIM
ncbi:DNA repair protein [Elizabethkingia anophelis]|nr:DNA repair protein [Elizabethkingia anophelis]